MSPEEVERRLGALRGDDRWADRPFRTAARPRARALPWRPVAALALALAAVAGITVLIGLERPHAAVQAAPRTAPVPWASLPAGGSRGALGTQDLPDTAALPLTAALVGAPHRGSDGALDYVVRLTNPSGSAVPLSPCPVYAESLVAGGRVLALQRYRLDCATAGPIAAGASRDFAMRIQAPNPGSGPVRLTWRLDSGATATKEIP